MQTAAEVPEKVEKTSIDIAVFVFSRERLAKGSCLVGLPLGASCPSRGVAARVAAALRARCRRIEILNFPKENQGFRA